MSVIEKDLGPVSAYAMAVMQGYTGTAEEFAILQAESGNNALKTAQQAQAAARSASDAEAARDRAESAAIRQPRPDASTKTWWVWDHDASAYADTGVSCGDAYLHPAEKTDGMTLGVGIDADGRLFAEKDPDVVKMNGNYEGGSGTSVSVTGAGVSPLKSLVITTNTDMPNNGNCEIPVPLGYSSGITVTYPDGTTDGFEPVSKLYFIQGPYSSVPCIAKRDWAHKKDTVRVYHYVFTGDEHFYLSSNKHIFSLQGMDNFEVPYMITSKCIIRCSHYVGTNYSAINSNMSSDDISAIDGTVAAYGSWNTSTLAATSKQVLFCDGRFSSVEDFKAYLKEQFNAGTPVEIAYFTGFEYEADIPESDYQLYAHFKMQNENCTVTNKDGCTLSCEWWRDFPVKNYIDWADSMKSYGGSNSGSSAYVTPEMYGAVGDGIADDTAAIQAALDFGGLVYCGKNYKFTSLTMNKEGTCLYAARSFASTSDVCALKISASNCRVRINTLKCTNGILFDGNYVGMNRIYDTNIAFYGQYGVKLDADVTKITNCEFDSVKCASANSGVGYGFWLSNEYSDDVYSYCNQHMFWNCQAYNCEIGALLHTRETYTDVAPVGDRMNCISFEKFNPEGCNLGIQLENFVNRCIFTDIRNNEFTGATAGWKPLIKLIGVSRGNTFSTTGVARHDMIIGERYQYCEYDQTYANSNSSTYTNVFRGRMISMSSGRVFDETNYVLIPDLKGGLLWRNANPSIRGVKYIPGIGNDGLDEYMTFNASTANDSMNIQTSVFETRASASGSPRLHLTREVTWNIHILVDPARPPIVVYDPYENIIFDVRDNLPSCKTMYTVHCDPDCSEMYYITKEPLCSEDADYVTSAEKALWNSKVDAEYVQNAIQTALAALSNGGVK